MNKDFIVYFDQSSDTFEGDLGKLGDNERFQIYAFCRTLHSSEKNYIVIEEELLAVIAAYKKFWNYIFGIFMVVITDQVAIKGLIAKMDTSTDIVGWIVVLSEYLFVFECHPNSCHNNADGLSWIPLHAHGDSYEACKSELRGAAVDEVNPMII